MFTRSSEKGPGNGTILANGKGTDPEFHSERKKRTTSAGCFQFPKRLSGKLPFHLTKTKIPPKDFRKIWKSSDVFLFSPNLFYDFFFLVSFLGVPY